MITRIDGLPQHVVGLRGTGEITSEDYDQVVVPALAGATATEGNVSLLYVLDDGASYDVGALVQDSRVGKDYMSKLDRLAVVTDDGRFRAAVTLFGMFMPGRVRVFGHDNGADAEQWVSQPTE